MKKSYSKARLGFFLGFILVLGLILFWWGRPLERGVSGFFQGILRPVLSFFSSSEEMVSDAKERFSSSDLKEKEILQLQEKIKNLENQHLKLKKELESLKQAKELSLWVEGNAFAGQAAKVLVQDVSSHRQSVLINRGSLQGLKVGQAVLAKGALVGRLIKVWDKTAQVLLINDPISRVDVVSDKNRARGSLKGKRLKLDLDRALYVSYGEYFDAHQTLEEGELLLTSGLDGLFPEGLPVARLYHVNKDETGLFWQGEARPLVEIATLNWLWVLEEKEEGR